MKLETKITAASIVVIVILCIVIALKNQTIDELKLDKEGFQEQNKVLKLEKKALEKSETEIEKRITILQTRNDSLLKALQNTPTDADIKDTHTRVDINDSWRDILRPMAAEIDSAAR